MVGTRLGRQVGGNLACIDRNFSMDGRFEGIGRTHHVAVHVTAGSQRVQQGMIDACNGGLEVAFQYTVELKSLSGGQFQCFVSVFVGQLIPVSYTHLTLPTIYSV